ncbi:MAG TPA: substrate-binding domain-containing protein [Mycobacteriales bacterium]|jgi:simple sugar transport system substrate-binding protein|nr:periplasmic binding protein/LacI transcriptional regulator [Cryptosporangiaceae bacterium]MDQ1674923.1 simple sugar transport system substrate-binding protein [Actinomycetota bacterium]HEV7754612.1 substrate-binding domain-containing protein [Mycobacteriales bacterium]
MIQHQRAVRVAALVAALLLATTGCSGTGGKKAEQAAGRLGAGVADTPRMKVAMVTHAPAGDTFWDLIRKGAQAAADKDNVELRYSAAEQAGDQANLVEQALAEGVDGIALTLAKPDAMKAAVAKAEAAGVPVVAFNAGLDNWKDLGVLEYFGQDESLAGRTAGQRLASEGAKKVLCVIHEQGHVALEARCAGVKQGMPGGSVENLNVTGTDMPSVRSAITGKLTQDPGIDRVITLGAPFALAAVRSVKDAGGRAGVVTFDTNKALVAAVKSGDVRWAIDQQPYLQGYLAVDSLWLYKSNGNVLGGGQTVLTGPSFIDRENIAKISKFAIQGTR